MRQAGFIDGENVRIGYRWAKGNYDDLPGLAADLVANNVLAIAATGDVASARAAQAASQTIPVVFTIGADPVRFGLVESMNRPGGHVTGISLLSSVLGAKRVELLHELAPRAKRIGLLMNPSNPNADAERQDAESGARSFHLETVAVNARNASIKDWTLTTFAKAESDELTTMNGFTFTQDADDPAIFQPLIGGDE